MCRVVQFGVVFALVGLAVLLPTMASASSISYTESFATSGSAYNEGDSMSNYPGWSYNEYNGQYGGGDLAGTSAVAGGGKLQLAASGGSHCFALLSSQQIAGVSAFDVTTRPLSVSAQISGDGEGGNYSVGLVVGHICTVFHPGYPTGALRVQFPMAYNIFVPNTDVGFTPAQGFGNLHTVTMSVLEDGTGLNYLVDYSLDTFHGQTLVPKADVGGQVARVGFCQGTAGIGYFTNLSVFQVPEPSTLAMAAMSLFGLLAYAWRRRK